MQPSFNRTFYLLGLFLHTDKIPTIYLQTTVLVEIFLWICSGGKCMDDDNKCVAKIDDLHYNICTLCARVCVCVCVCV